MSFRVVLFIHTLILNVILSFSLFVFLSLSAFLSLLAAFLLRVILAEFR